MKKSTSEKDITIVVRHDKLNDYNVTILFSIINSASDLNMEIDENKFTEVNSNPTNRLYGISLSLAVCGYIINQYGGKFYSEKSKNRVTNFHFSLNLPLQKQLPTENNILFESRNLLEILLLC